MERQPGEGSGAGDEVPDSGLPGGETPGPGPDPTPSAEGPAGSGPAGTTSDPGLAGFVNGGVWIRAPRRLRWRRRWRGRRGRAGGVRAGRMRRSWGRCGRRRRWSRGVRGQARPDPGGDPAGRPAASRRGVPRGPARRLVEVADRGRRAGPGDEPGVGREAHSTAWDLGALLPGIGALLEDGTLTYPKARAVNDALELLSEPDKARAEAIIAGRLGGKTFGQVEKIAARAAITVDPELAERSREHAERNRARVILKRERSGAASLSGYELPPAETLAAHAAACARAQVYKESGAFPGVLMDQFRAMAYLDLMNEISAEARIAQGPPDAGLGAPGEAAFRDEPEPDDPGAPAPEGQRRVRLPLPRVRRQMPARC